MYIKFFLRGWFKGTGRLFYATIEWNLSDTYHDRNFRSREVPLETIYLSSKPEVLDQPSGEKHKHKNGKRRNLIYPKRVIVQIQAVVGRALPVREPSSPPIKRSMASRRKLSQGLGLLDMYT
ncbi:hypothetical protein AFLA_010968 [Aspergillus flavus NRRL3357]|nr:hypothetical protein AFLA_010968 [Aspergillus flavus NRRL3357]